MDAPHLDAYGSHLPEGMALAKGRTMPSQIYTLVATCHDCKASKRYEAFGPNVLPQGWVRAVVGQHHHVAWPDTAPQCPECYAKERERELAAKAQRAEAIARLRD
jgi:hypothetical protein